MTAIDTPRVVPTMALGRRFRSTTEARWAVWLTKAGVSFEYEPETYDLGDPGWYLPDFHLTARDWFLEVKPGREHMLDEDYDRARALHLATRRPVLVANGMGPLPDRGMSDHGPGWIYDIFTNGDTTAETAGVGGGGYRLALRSDGCLALAFRLDETELVGGQIIRAQEPSGTWYMERCPHHATADWRRTHDAYEAAISFRPDSR